MAEETGLVKVNGGALEGASFGIVRAPKLVLQEAREAAVALKEVIDGKAKPVIFNGEKYLEFEDWQTVGQFYGIAPRILRTTFVEFGQVQGWEASAEAVHIPSGRIIASADAMCLNDEEKWRSRPKYLWLYVKKSGGTSLDDPGRNEIVWEGKRPKKVRVQQGEEHVPMFQLRSMAQTRAGAKALRNALAWVVVLAGYRPTPAEEMDGAVPDSPGKAPTAPPSAPAQEHEEEPPHPAETVPEPSQAPSRTLTDVLTDSMKGGYASLSTEDRLVLWRGSIEAAPDKNVLAKIGKELAEKEPSDSPVRLLAKAVYSKRLAELAE